MKDAIIPFVYNAAPAVGALAIDQGLVRGTNYSVWLESKLDATYGKVAEYGVLAVGSVALQSLVAAYNSDSTYKFKLEEVTTLLSAKFKLEEAIKLYTENYIQLTLVTSLACAGKFVAEYYAPVENDVTAYLDAQELDNAREFDTNLITKGMITS